VGPTHRAWFTRIVGPAARAPQRIGVPFTAVPGGTEVVLRHSGWEALGAEGAALRERFEQGGSRSSSSASRPSPTRARPPTISHVNDYQAASTGAAEQSC
jgi:hypothetical protein